jgi:hypothetical protein
MIKDILTILGWLMISVAASAQEPLKFFINGGLETRTNVTFYGQGFNFTMSGFPGGHIFYTTNGAPPSVASAEYSAGLNFSANATIRAVAYDAAFAEFRTAFIVVTVAPLQILHLLGAAQFVEYSVDGSPFAPAPGDIYIGSAQTVALRAAGSGGWRFDQWKGDRPSLEATNIFQMNQDLTVRLSVKRTEPLTVPFAGDGEVIVSPPPPYYWDDPLVQITAVPHDGKFFAGWNLPQSFPTSISFTQRVDDPPPKATFSTLLEGTFAISVKIDGQGTVLSPTRYFAAAGSTVQVTVQPPAGWSVTNWTGDATGPGTKSYNPYGTTVTVDMSANRTVEAHVNELANWRAQEIEGYILGSQAVGPDGTVIIVGGNMDNVGVRYFFAFGRDGYKKWTLPTTPPSKYAPSGVMVGPDGTIYDIISSIGIPYVLAISADGREKWRALGSGIYVYAAVNENGLYMSSSNQGRKVRRYWTDGTLLQEASGGLFNSYKGIILDVDSNALLGGQEFTSFTPELAPRYNRTGGGFAGMTDLHGNFIATDLQALRPDGTPLWTNAYTNGSPLCLSTNRVYIGDSNNGGSLSALDLATGQKVWSFLEPYAGVSVQSAVVAEDNSLFAIFSGTLLRKISASGEIVWETRCTGVNPLLTPDGQLYVGPMGFSVGVGPAKSGFPMLHADAGNSGAAYTGVAPALDTLALESGPSGLVLRFLPSAPGTSELQWSEDFTVWQTLQTFSVPLKYTVPTPLETQRFYRVVTP